MECDPRKHATMYDGYLINGFIFHIKIIENVRSTQNSGVCIDEHTLMRSMQKKKSYMSNNNKFWSDSRNNHIGLLLCAISLVQM